MDRKLIVLGHVKTFLSIASLSGVLAFTVYIFSKILGMSIGNHGFWLAWGALTLYGSVAALLRYSEIR